VYRGIGEAIMSGKKRRRMTLPKKREDLEKVVQEVQESHAHGHHHDHGHEHHHHHHVDIDEILYALDIQLTALTQRIRVLEDRVRRQQIEIATLYKILASLVEAIGAGDEEAKKKALTRALAVLEGVPLEDL